MSETKNAEIVIHINVLLYLYCHLLLTIEHVEFSVRWSHGCNYVVMTVQMA